MEKTVLILGAGISAPYGYPTGEELVSKIITNHKFSRTENLRKLAIALEDSSSKSIDRFLSERESFFELGVGAIVDELLVAEQASMTKEVKPDLDIFKLLLNELKTVDYENLKIITFNYDRLFEWKFFKKIRTLVDTDEQALLILEKIEIEHIHGQLPQFTVVNSRPSENYVPYGLWHNGITTDDKQHYATVAKRFAVKNFKTVFTNDDKPNEKAVKWIKSAKRVFFLGFSFDEKNMQKLGFGSKDITYDWASKCLAGTCYEIKPIDHKKLMSNYPILKEKLFNVPGKQFFTDMFCLTNTAHDIVEIHVQNKSCCEIAAVQGRVPKNDNSNVTEYTDVFQCPECSKAITAIYSRPLNGDFWTVRTRNNIGYR